MPYVCVCVRGGGNREKERERGKERKEGRKEGGKEGRREGGKDIKKKYRLVLGVNVLNDCAHLIIYCTGACVFLCK